MSEPDTKNSSASKWDKVDKLADETIDSSDIPPLDENFFQRARWRMPPRHGNFVSGC